MANELFDSVYRSLSGLVEDAKRAQAAQENLKAGYEARREQVLREEREALALAATQRAARDSDLQARRSSVERSYNDELVKTAARYDEELSDIDARLAKIKDIQARIPADLQYVMPQPADVEEARGYSDEQLNALVDQMADRSFWTSVKRFLGIGGILKREVACARVLAATGEAAQRLKGQREEAARRRGDETRGLLAQRDSRLGSIELGDTPGASEQDVRRRFSVKLEEVEASYRASARQLEQTRQSRRDADSVIAECRRRIGEAQRGLVFAPSARYVPAREFPRYSPIGYVSLGMAGASLSVPYVFDWDDLRGCWFSVGRHREQALAWVRAMVADVIRQMPVGGLAVYWLDPTNAGLSLGALGSLSTRVTSRESSLIKLASTESDVGTILSDIDNRVGDIGPLVASAGSLRRYNSRLVGGNPIPQTLVVVNDLSNPQFGTYGINAVSKMLDNAAKLGMQVLVLSDKEPDPDERRQRMLEELRGRFLEIREADESGVSHDPDRPFSIYLQGYGVFPIGALNSALASESFVGEYLAAVEALGDQHGSVDLSNVPVRPIDKGIDIPVGITDLGEPVIFSLGDSPAHAIVTGEPGSGKSVFLRNVIEGACTRYRPDELEIWMVDYKKSDFASLRYAEGRFPHISFFGSDPSADFVTSFVGKLNDEIGHRQNLFVSGKVAGIQAYNEHRAPEERLTRLVVIIDEFHYQAAFMAGPDGADTKRKFETILRVARAFGVHIIVASQTISGMSGLSATARAQMGGRVLLLWNDVNEPRDMFGSGGFEPLEPGSGEGYVKVGGEAKRCRLRFVGPDELADSADRYRAWLGAQACRTYDERFVWYDPTTRTKMAPSDYHPDDDRGHVGIPLGLVPNFNNPMLKLVLGRANRQNVLIFNRQPTAANDAALLLAYGYAALRPAGHVVVVADPYSLDYEDAKADDANRWESLAATCENVDVLTGLPEIATFFREARVGVPGVGGWQMEGGVISNALVVLVGFETLAEQMEDSAVDAGGAPSQAQQARALASCYVSPFSSNTSSPDQAAAEGQAGQEAAPDASVSYDVRGEIWRLIQRGGSRDAHVCLISSDIPKLSSLFPASPGEKTAVSDAFPHRIATRCSTQSAMDLGMNNLASNISDDQESVKVVYSDGRDRGRTVSLYDPADLLQPMLAGQDTFSPSGDWW